MKITLILILLTSVVQVACNNNKPKTGEITITDDKGNEKAVIVPTGGQDALQEMMQRKEELTKLTPLTKEELTALLPKEMMGAMATNVDIDAAMGASVASADYKINDTMKLKLEIIDCAGPGGAGMYGAQYLNMFDVNSDDEEEYVKTIEFNGGKAFENCKKKRNRCTLVWFSGNRFLMSLKGDNVGIEAIKTNAADLKIK